MIPREQVDRAAREGFLVGAMSASIVAVVMAAFGASAGGVAAGLCGGSAVVALQILWRRR